MVFALLSLALVLTVFVLLLIYSVRTGISPVPTTPRVAEALLALVPEIPPGTVYELGSGWGNPVLSSGIIDPIGRPSEAPGRRCATPCDAPASRRRTRLARKPEGPSKGIVTSARVY